MGTEFLRGSGTVIETPRGARNVDKHSGSLDDVLCVSDILGLLMSVSLLFVVKRLNDPQVVTTGKEQSSLVDLARGCSDGSGYGPVHIPNGDAYIGTGDDAGYGTCSCNYGLGCLQLESVCETRLVLKWERSLISSIVSSR